jgi:TonB family protein
MFSLSRNHRAFYYLLAGVLALHATFMVMKFSRDFTLPKWSKTEKVQPEPIKITFAPGTLENFTTSKKKQIVQSEDSAYTEKKADAFLSDKDRSFDRQTMAKNVDIFNKTGKGNAAQTLKSEKAEPQAKPAKDFKDIKLSDIGINTGEPLFKKAERAPTSASEKGLENGDPTSKGFSSTNDYVQEVALGDFTHLNTVEFKFYGFYHRIRQKLEQFWGKSIQEKSHALFRSGRRMPASQDYITSLQVTLNAKGEIVQVKILGASGVKELDDAAIESFNQAGPFPNPPKDLLVNGKATIEWGFVVKS